jgi:hypothetical protein
MDNKTENIILKMLKLISISEVATLHENGIHKSFIDSNLSHFPGFHKYNVSLFTHWCKLNEGNVNFEEIIRSGCSEGVINKIFELGYKTSEFLLVNLAKDDNITMFKKVYPHYSEDATDLINFLFKVRPKLIGWICSQENKEHLLDYKNAIDCQSIEWIGWLHSRGFRCSAKHFVQAIETQNGAIINYLKKDRMFCINKKMLLTAAEYKDVDTMNWLMNMVEIIDN